jgi:hypothetical protein
MSDFWGLSDGDTAKATTEFDAGGGSIEPIPDGTQVLAMVDEAKWGEKDGAEFISLRWTTLKPDQYKNRKFFQKLWVLGNNPNQGDATKAKKQGDKAKQMLAAIDTNAGGKLLESGGKPDDMALQSGLIGKPMVVRLGVWEMTGSDGSAMSGNWVQQVAAKGSADVDTATSKPAPKAPAGQVDDEIPFAPEWRI